MLRVSFPYDPDLERLQGLLEQHRGSGDSAKEALTGAGSAGWRRWLRLLVALLAFLLLIGLLLAAGLAYQQYTTIERPAAERRAEAALARQTVRLALDSGDCRWAEEAYRNLLHFVPEETSLAAELDRCQERLKLDSLYAQAVTAMKAGDWKASHAAFAAIAKVDPSYPGLADETAILEDKLEIETGWSEAQAACQAQDWQSCVASLQAVQQADLYFRRDDVQALLANAAVQSGLDCVARSHGSEELLAEAIAYYDLALLQEPGLQQALMEREMVARYALAVSLYEHQAWGAAVEQLEILYDIRQDYADGHVAGLLFQAWCEQGASLEAMGDLVGSLACYEAACLVAGVDTGEALKAMARMEALLTPLPTPTSMPTAIPSAVASATATPKPTSRPAPTLSPTPTPLPFQFTSRGATLTRDVTCNSLTVQGWVRDGTYPMPGVEVTIGADSWSGPMVITDVDGYYYYFLDDHPKNGTWYIKLSIAGEQISDAVPFSTRADCDSNLVYISWESRY